MKKLLAMILALMMVLTGTFACADSVYTNVSFDRDVAKTLMTSFGMEEETVEMADIILAIVSALGVRVIPGEDGAQIDLDLNGIEACSFAFTADDEGAVIASTLFPNYVVTVKQETITEMMASASESIPGAENGMDMEAMAKLAEVFGGYFTRYIEACGAAATVGEPETGEYEMDDHTFDTMTPVTVDMSSIVAATEELFNDIMNDEAAMDMISSFVKDEDGNPVPEAELREGLGEFLEAWKSHVPDEASAEFYSNSDGSEAFYLYSEASYEGKEEPSYEFYMFSGEDGSGYMGFLGNDEVEFDVYFEYGDGYVAGDFTAQDVYFGFGASYDEDGIVCDIYVMNDESPVMRVTVTFSEEGEITLSTDKEGKNVLAVEDAMADEEAAGGLIGDVMANGLGGVLAALSEAVPEAAALFSSAE